MKRNSKVNEKLDALRGAAGADRASYFAAGLPLAGWRGLHQVQKDRRKSDAKKACRGRVRED